MYSYCAKTLRKHRLQGLKNFAAVGRGLQRRNDVSLGTVRCRATAIQLVCPPRALPTRRDETSGGVDGWECEIDWCHVVCTEVGVILARASPSVGRTRNPCAPQIVPRIDDNPGARVLDFPNRGSKPARIKERRWKFCIRIAPV
jgi:hypothetical protein